MKYPKTLLYLIFLFFFLQSFTPGTESIAYYSFPNKIQNYVDSSENYIIRDTVKFNFWLNEAIKLTKYEKDKKPYLKIIRYSKLKFNGVYYKINAWKLLLLEIDALSKELGDEVKKVIFDPVVDSQIQWAIYYQSINDNAHAIRLFRKAAMDLSQLPKDSAVCYNQFFNSYWLASVYKKTGAFDAAIQENLHSILFYQEYEKKIKTPESIPYLSNICTTLGDLYLTKNDTVKAFEYYKKAQVSLVFFLKSVVKPSINPISAIHNIKYSLVKYYNHIKKYDQSLRLLQEIKTTLGEGNPFWGKCHMGIGDVFARKNNIDSAVAHYQSAEQFFKKLYTAKHPQTAIANLRIAEVYKNQKNWKLALAYYQKAINNCITSFNEKAFWENPNHLTTKQINGKLELLDAFKGKTEAFFNLYQTSRHLATLKKAQETSNLTVSLIDTIKNSLFLDKDRLFQVSNHFTTYEQAIAIAQELSQLSKQTDHAQQERIFNLVEKSKALVLQASFIKGFMGESGNKELAQLIEKERQLKYVLSRREEELTRNNLPLHNDKHLLELQYQFHSWMQEAKRSNPQYYHQKYEPSQVSLQTLQRQSISSRQVFVEYFWGEQFFFTLAITPTQIKVYQEEIGSLADSLQVLRSLVIKSADPRYIAPKVHLQELSHYLYRCLLEPVLKDLKGKYSKLCIVRDGPLEYLPFEILDVSSNTGEGVFSAEEFLLEHYIISYAHSGTLLREQQRLPSTKAKRFFAGFAPSYQRINPTDTLDSQVLASLGRSGNIDLPGARAETQQISSLMDGKIYLGAAASEKQFKIWAPQYSILHLAMHALANDQRPESSELLFAEPNPDPSEDGHFKAWELYGLPLQAQMVVLSACETGDGKLQRGEGVISLAYAFFNAGVPSLVSTQWKVNDSSTRFIIEEFYKNLKKGMRKDRALQKAKKTYIEQEKKDPFFWAPLVATGDMSRVDFPSSMSNGSFIAIWMSAIVLLIGIAFWIKKRAWVKKL